MSVTDQDVELLLVEDQQDQARFVERVLRKQQSSLSEGATHTPIEVTKIHHVTSLSAALEHLEAATPDVVLLDLMLPDSRGIETLEQVVEHAPDVPVVVLTGRNETEVGVDAVQRGAQEFLSKANVTGETILRTLRYAIERSRTQRRLVDRNHRLALLNQILREDIRADLSVIVGLTDQVQGDGSDTDERTIASLLDTAQHAAERTDIAATVVDVISAADLDRKPCDLYAVLETAVSRVHNRWDVDITIERNDTDDGHVIVAASPMLESVFNHLFENVIDRSDGPTPEITVTVATTAEEVTVEIVSNCAEMPARDTDPDVRVDTRSGMDLRRYLVLTVLESFGGSLEIDATERGDTRMTVVLPHRDGSYRESKTG